jgi:hypothetical protein
MDDLFKIHSKEKLKSSTRKMIKKKTLIIEEKKKSVSRRNGP